MAWICDKNGNHRCEIKKLSYNGTFMEVSSLTVTVESATPVAFAVGDYIDWGYDGMRYTLDTAAGVQKQARRQSVGNAFVYENLVFLSPLSAADHVDFLDVILGNTNEFLTNTEFSFYGTAWDYAKRLEANLCRLHGSGTWKVRIWTGGTCYDTTPATGIDTGSWENKLVDVSGIKCLAGFQQIYELWGCAYVFSVVSGVNYVDFYDVYEDYAAAWTVEGDPKIFAYGKGNGLYKIRHTPDADHVLVTRLRAYGSGNNIPANYYLNSPDYHVNGNESSELAISHLMLPASEWTKNGVKSPANAYLEQNTEIYGVREGVVLWDGSDEELGEIKPSIYGLTIQDLLDRMATGAAYRPVEVEWPDTSQRIDKIITGAAPTDNGVKAEAGYDFTVVESSGTLSARNLDAVVVNKDVEFDDIVMSTTPSVSHLAEYRIVLTSANKKAVSFDIPSGIASRAPEVTATITPYVDGRMVGGATIPCQTSMEAINNTVEGVVYTARFFVNLVDATGNPIVFSTTFAGDVTFRIRASIDLSNVTSGFSVLRKEYTVGFNLLRGNKAIDGFFSVTIPQIGFDLAAAVANGAKLCMRSGANQPREFQIVPSSVRYIEDTDTWYMRCKRVADQSIQTYFPNSGAVIATGDEYYLTGISMPALYVEIAAGKLLTAAAAWLEKHSKPRMLSSVDIDNKIMATEGIVLREGMSLPISDTDLGITPQNQESKIIDNIRIEEGADSIRTFAVTLRDKKEKSSLDAAIRGATSQFATNSSVSEAVSGAESRDHSSLSGRDLPNQHTISSITGLEEALASLNFFERDGSGNIKLKDEFGGLWTSGSLTAGTPGSSSGGGGGSAVDWTQILQSGTKIATITIDDDAPIDVYAPAQITESDVSGWGFTKNAGTITGITMNGASKGTSGVVDLGNVITAHQSVTSENATIGTALTKIATIGGTEIKAKITHQSLANYVTLNSAQTITAIKTFNEKIIANNGIRLTTGTPLKFLVSDTEYSPLVFNAWINSNKLYFAITPDVRVTGDATLGTSGDFWKGVYAEDMYAKDFISWKVKGTTQGANDEGVFRFYTRKLVNDEEEWKNSLTVEYDEGLTADGDIKPLNGGTNNLGSSAAFWNKGYIKELHMAEYGTSIFAGGTGDDAILSIWGSAQDHYGDIVIGHYNASARRSLRLTTKDSMYFSVKNADKIIMGANNFRPAANNGLELGTSSFRWSTIHASKWYPGTDQQAWVELVDGRLTVHGDLVATGNIVAGTPGQNTAGDYVEFTTALNTYSSDDAIATDDSTALTSAITAIQSGSVRRLVDANGWYSIMSVESDSSTYGRIYFMMRGAVMCLYYSNSQSKWYITDDMSD